MPTPIVTTTVMLVLQAAIYIVAIIALLAITAAAITYVKSRNPDVRHPNSTEVNTDKPQE